MPITLESEIEGYLYRRVKELKGECIKLLQGQGLPDRMVVLPKGKMFFVETKRDGGGSRLSELQNTRIKRLRRLGVRVHTPISKKSIDRILDIEINGRQETVSDMDEVFTNDI